MKRIVLASVLALGLSGGCARERGWIHVQHGTSNPPAEPAVDMQGNPISRAELTPEGRWIKRVDIRSEPQGARIMVAGYYVGETPMLVAIPCTPSGRFKRTTKIRLLPTVAGGRLQSEVYRAGTEVPSRLAFEARALPPWY